MTLGTITKVKEETKTKKYGTYKNYKLILKSA